MRKSIVIAASMLFVVSVAFAQEPTRANSVSVFVSDVAIRYTDSNGTNVDAAFGAAFDHMFTKRVSAELSVTRQRRRLSSVLIGSGGEILYSSYTNSTYPVDATVSYHFLTDNRWKPYIGGGLRYVSSSIRNDNPFDSYRFSSHTIDPEISGGVTFQFRPALGLRFDAKQVIGNSGSAIGDAAFTASVGLSFRF